MLFPMFLHPYCWRPLIFQLSLVLFSGPFCFPGFFAVVSLQLLITLLLVMFPPVVASILLLVSPAVPVVSCVAVGPVVDVFLQMLFVPDIPAIARVSAVAAFRTAVEVSFLLLVFSMFMAIPAVVGLPAIVGFHAVVASLLLLASSCCLCIRSCWCTAVAGNPTCGQPIVLCEFDIR